MIKRYSRKELTDIWSEENKYKIWLDVEVSAAQAMEKLGQIPKGVSSVVRKKARINVKRIHLIESQVKHDVIAFLTSITEKAGIKARYLHQGMTFTIEPMINTGEWDVKMLKDGWTAVTKDKTLSAQFEHTLGITENGYEIFTESAKGYSKPPYL